MHHCIVSMSPLGCYSKYFCTKKKHSARAVVHMPETRDSNLSKKKNMSPEEGFVPTDVSGTSVSGCWSRVSEKTIVKGDGYAPFFSL